MCIVALIGVKEMLDPGKANQAFHLTKMKYGRDEQLIAPQARAVIDLVGLWHNSTLLCVTKQQDTSPDHSVECCIEVSLIIWNLVSLLSSLPPGEDDMRRGATAAGANNGVFFFHHLMCTLFANSPTTSRDPTSPSSQFRAQAINVND